MTANAEHYCSVFTHGDLSPRALQLLAGHKAALLKDAKWVVGTVITVQLLDAPPALRARVQEVAEEWTKIANLTLDFRIKGPTDIRIAFTPGNGSWSYLGTMCRHIPEPQPTMNYGWLTAASSDEEVRRVVLHEFGHALGLIHEHQNPKGGIDWNRQAVIDALTGPPNNWSLATIEENIFKKYEPETVVDTALDPLSIMMYPIPLAWTRDGKSAGLNSQLSGTDRDFVAQIYPK